MINYFPGIKYELNHNMMRWWVTLDQRADGNFFLNVRWSFFKCWTFLVSVLLIKVSMNGNSLRVALLDLFWFLADVCSMRNVHKTI